MKNVFVDDNLEYYLKDVRKFPTINQIALDEIFGKLHNKNTPKEIKKELLDKIVVGNLRIVVLLAKKYQGCGIPFSDLISEGNIGLMKAAEMFNPHLGYKFTTYAKWWIEQSIMASLNYSSQIRLPANIAAEQRKLKKQNYNNEFFDTTGNGEIPIPVCVSLDTPIDHDGNMMIEIISDESINSPDQSVVVKNEVNHRVASILKTLNDNERIIIQKHFGLIDGVEISLEDLGRELNYSKERVRQIKERAIKKLRNKGYSLLQIFHQ